MRVLRQTAVVALALLVSSCSAVVGQRRDCASSDECRSLFGFGSVCGSDGLCRTLPPHPRCARSEPPDLLEHPERHGDTFVVGTIYSTTAAGQVTLRAAELAFRQAMRAGGLYGRDVALLHCDPSARIGDELEDPEASAAAARYLAELGVPAILGPTTSARVVAAHEALRGRDVLLVSPSATSSELEAIDDSTPSDAEPGLLWRTVASDDLQGRVIASDMRMRGVTSLSILYRPDTYGEALATLVERALTGTVTVNVQPFAPDTLASKVVELAERNDDEVLFISSILSESIGFLNAASVSDSLRARYLARGIFLPDSASHPQLLTEVTPSARELFANVRGTRPAISERSELRDELFAAFVVEYGGDPSVSSFTAQSYDAAWLVLYGAAWALAQEGALTGTTLARGLRHVSEGAPQPIRPSTWDELTQAFTQGSSVDVEGASGPLDYDLATEELLAPIEVWTLQQDGGSWVLRSEYVVQPRE
jgi:branched-chain amino acid transport system substrate-binding protein